MSEKIEIKIIMFLVLLTLLLVAIFGFNKKEGKLELLKDSSEFYMISGCVNRYFLYQIDPDTDKVYTILNKDYKKEKNITLENIKDTISLETIMYTYDAKKIYKQQLSKNVFRYYVTGLAQPQTLEGNGDTVTRKFVVTLYHQNSTFDIKPYEGNII